MGNSAAVRYEAVQSLKQELGLLNQQLASAQNVQRREIIALEHKLHKLAAERLNTGFFPRNQKTGGVERFGATLRTDDSVQVRLGPVVGKVTATSAIILLEIDKRADVVCNVSLVDQVAPQGRVVATVRQTMPANAPRSFRITGLSVNQRYKVSFSGVSRADAEERVAQFKTFDPVSNSLRAVLVSGDRPEALGTGDINVWEKVAARVASYEVDVMLHVGGQVHSSRAFRDAMIVFQRHAQTGFATTSQLEIEEVTRERLRDVYRRCWNLPRTRKVLASCSHLMIWNDEDVCRNFTIATNSLGDPISPDMIRLAHQVYREYQRQLWDPDCTDSGPVMFGASQGSRRSQALYEAVRRRTAEKLVKKRQAGESKKGRRRGGSKGVDDRGGEDDDEDADMQVELMGAASDDDDDDDELAAAATELPGQEHHFHRFGGIGVLFIDMRGGRILEKGGQALDNPIVSQFQWEHIEKALEDRDDTLRVLVVCCERPLVEETPASAKVRSRRPETVAVKERWAYNDHELLRLLSMLVAWKTAKPNREVQICSGGLHVGVETLVKHQQSGTELNQLALGPITDDVSDLLIPMEGVADEKGMFTYVHRRMNRPQRNYALLEAVVPFGSSPPSVSVSLIGAIERPPRALVGPIIGKVTSTTAIIVLEVEEPAVITCVLTDILSREVYKFVQMMPARRPKAFVARDLRPERRYELYFNGIAHWNQHRGALTTLAEDHLMSEMAVVTVHGDRPDRLDPSAPNPWRLIHEQLEFPWGGPDLVLHVGAQVDPSIAFAEAIAVLRRDGERSIIEEEAKQRIRSVYRFAWNLPHTKEVLARTSNLMIWSDVDLAEGFTLPDGGPALGPESASWGPVLLRLAREVYREYQRQLWDAEAMGEATWSPLEGRGGVSERVIVKWGPVGLILLDTFGARLGASGHVLHNVESLLSEQHWREVAAALADPELRVVCVASPTVVLDDSPDDAVLKAIHPSKALLRNRWPFHRTDLERLLRTLFAWKTQSTVEINNTTVSTRDVMLVSGGSTCGAMTNITDASLRSTIRQVTPPPITDQPTVPECEKRGHIDAADTMSYIHNFQSGRGFGLVRLQVKRGEVEGGNGSATCSVYVPDDSADVFGLSQKMMRLPSWVKSALDEAYARDEDDEEMMEIIAAEAKAAETKAGGGASVLGSGAMEARRALRQIFLSKPFKSAVAKTYDRYSAASGGSGIPASQLLAAVRHFFYKVSCTASSAAACFLSPMKLHMMLPYPAQCFPTLSTQSSRL